MTSINIGIVGATGYTGGELMRLLCGHPNATLRVATSDAEKGQRVSDVFPGLRMFTALQFEEHLSTQLELCDLIFFATPHATAMRQVTGLLDSGCRIIDLSADFRIKDIAVWEKWYKVKHACPGLVKEAVYGLPELHREAIKGAKLVANPGCYATATILALLPVIKNKLINPADIIVDAKSGVSGAGRQAIPATRFSEISESFSAYSASGHRHLPEIVQILDSVQSDSDVNINLTFVPHLLPLNRGIHITAYVKPVDYTVDMQNCYSDFYEHEYFVDVLPPGGHPETGSVRGTNICRLSLHPSRRTSQPAVILAVIDNLTKGAAGQAIQNMNLMFGLDEATGLTHPGFTP